MDMETRARVAFASAMGAYMELAGEAGQASALQWIGEGFPRAAGGPLAQAQLLMLAVDREPAMGPEALYNTAAAAYGGRMGGYGELGEARRAAFCVFRAVAASLPREAAAAFAVPDVSPRLIRMQPRDPFRMIAGLGEPPGDPNAGKTAAKPPALAPVRKKSK